jgi:hypothetical protein
MQWSVDTTIAEGQEGQKGPDNTADYGVHSWTQMAEASLWVERGECGERVDDIDDVVQLRQYSNIKRDLPTMSWRQWASALKLSTMWQMEEIRQIAFERVFSNLPDSLEEWVGLLRLATSSGLPEIQKIALQHLDKTVTGAKRVQLALEFDKEDWLISGYQQLVEQTDPISEVDEECLGRGTVTKLFKLRHRRLQGRQPGYGESDIRETICRDMVMNMETHDNNGSQVAEADQSDTSTGGAAIKRDESLYLTSVVFLVRKFNHVTNMTNIGTLHCEG